MQTLYLDYSKCIGCGTCESVCRFVHQYPRILMTRTTDGWWVPLYCQHCEKPKCMKACNKNALYRDADTGAVLLNQDLCSECATKNCLLACPYVAMVCTGTRQTPITKCNLCLDRGSLGPACASMCPCDALMLLDRKDLEKVKTPESRQAWELVRRHIICPECPTT